MTDEDPVAAPPAQEPSKTIEIETAGGTVTAEVYEQPVEL